MNILKLLLVVFFILGGCVNTKNKTYPENLITKFPYQYLSLHSRINKIKSTGWMARHSESGQTFEEYLQENPTLPTGTRSKIYLLPLGNLNQSDSQLVQFTAEYLNVFFQSEVEIQTPLQNLKDTIPKNAQRIHHNQNQLHTKFILSHILQANLPTDSWAYIALTPEDLYPALSWGFVFGEATLHNRVAVSSFHRHKKHLGNHLKNELSAFEKIQKTRLRTLKTTSHEIGHILSMRHCTEFNCLMNGSNNQKEADSRPFFMCPVCIQKLNYALKTDLKTRYEGLLQFFEKYHFKAEAKLCKKVLKSLKKSTNVSH